MLDKQDADLRLSEMMKLLHCLEREHLWLFSSHTAAFVTGHAHTPFFLDQLQHYVNEGLIENYGEDIYGFAVNSMIPNNAQELLAVRLREWELNYVSFEYALNSYGVISQIPTLLTVATTGKSGLFATKNFRIEFSHIEHDAGFIYANTTFEENIGIRVASPSLALLDLEDLNRNLHLVDMEEYREACSDYADQQKQ